MSPQLLEEQSHSLVSLLATAWHVTVSSWLWACWLEFIHFKESGISCSSRLLYASVLHQQLVLHGAHNGLHLSLSLTDTTILSLNTTGASLLGQDHFSTIRSYPPHVIPRLPIPCHLDTSHDTEARYS